MNINITINITKLQLLIEALGVSLILLVLILRGISHTLINKKDYLRGYKFNLLANKSYLLTLGSFLVAYVLKIIWILVSVATLTDLLRIAWTTLLVYLLSKWIGETLIDIDKNKTKIEKYKNK